MCIKKIRVWVVECFGRVNCLLFNLLNILVIRDLVENFLSILVIGEVSEMGFKLFLMDFGGWIFGIGIIMVCFSCVGK